MHSEAGGGGEREERKAPADSLKLGWKVRKQEREEEDEKNTLQEEK